MPTIEDQAGNGSRRMITLERDLVPEAWRNSADYSCTLFIFCPSAFLNVDIAEDVHLINRICSKLSGHPVVAHFVGFEEGPEFPRALLEVAYRSGVRHWRTKVERSRLPPGEYCIVGSPFNVDLKAANLEHTARMASYMCRGLITSLYGTSMAECPAAELHIHHADGKVSTTSEVMENYPVGPREYACVDAESMRMLADRIETSFPEEVRALFETAFRFIERTAYPADRNVRFSNAWTALEVACGGRGKAAQQVSALCKGVPDVFRKLKSARDDLHHSGKDFEMSAREERILRASVLAALCKRFNLSSRIET